MDEYLVSCMDYCGEYFATRYERVRDVKSDGATVNAAFVGDYRAGDLVRIHGAYTDMLNDYGVGGVYEVQQYDDGAIVLDRPLHTRGDRLLIAFLEPSDEFKRLSEQIREWRQKNEQRRGLASESIDGYSWSAANGSDGTASWTSAFREELRPFRVANPTRLYYMRNCRSWSE